MMTRTILISLLLFFFVNGRAQDITRAEGEALENQLRTASSDSARIFLLIKVAEYHTIGNYDHKPNVDTAALLISQAEKLNAKEKLSSADIQLMMAKSYLFRTSGKREEGKRIILAMIDLLKDGRDDTSLGRAYYELSLYYDYDFKPNTVETRCAYLQQAIAPFERAGAINDLGNAYKVLADLHHLDNHYDLALQEIEIALKYYKISHWKRMEGVYDLYGQLYFARGDYEQALNWELMALKTTNSNQDAGPQLCEIENNVGLTMFKMNNPEAARPHFKNALYIAEKEHDNETIYALTAQIVQTYIASQQPKEALAFLKSVESEFTKPTTNRWETEGYLYKTYLSLYTSLGQYDAARTYCDKLIIKTRERGTDVFRLNGYYEEIIKYLIAIRDMPEAVKYLRSNKELLERINDDIGLSRNYNLWFSLDTTQGNYRTAVADILKEKLIDDTILNAEKSNAVRKLEIQYESEKKENDIRLKDQEIKALEESQRLRLVNLEQTRFTRNLMVGTSLLLALLGSILFLQYKQKRKANIVITHRNEQLGHLLEEKEWLVREVHHRVKNNLQMVISLLNIQSSYLDNDAAILAIKDSQRRMQAISLIHQKLYQDNNVSVIDMPAYINELITYLKEMFISATWIYFEQDVAPVQLDVAQAIPVGLILNEVIINSIKYAFDQNDTGVIRVSLRATDDQHLVLIVSDNGKGLPENFNAFEGRSLGMSLVTELVKQLEGSLRFLNDGGAKMIVVFPYDKMHIDLKTAGSAAEYAN
jgi:two-component sensor histidine kinase/Tfp pilus assembly protein PilF